MRRFGASKNLFINQLFLEGSQEMILFFDLKGRILQCSQEAKKELGYGEDILDISVDCIFKNAFIYEDNIIKPEEKFRGPVRETIAYRKDHSCFSVDLKVVTIQDKNTFMGICTAVNIDEIKQAVRENTELKQELTKSHKVSSDLVVKIAHELRTPLNGIMGFANDLLETDLQPKQREAVNIINKCSTNMRSLINDLLDYAKITNKELTIESKEFSLRELIHHIVDFNLVGINEKGLKLLVYVSNEIPDRLIGDELRLIQVLNNLFSNALKFTPSGQISLEIIKILQTEHEIELLFMVIDTGIGIDREDISKLFYSFSQIDDSLNRKYGGTGLGLSICKRIVEAMHGKITVDSEKNKGSNFSFTVPLGISRKSGVSYIKTHRTSLPYVQDGETEEKSDTSDFDYVSMRLEGISVCSKKQPDSSEEDDFMRLDELIEKLTICIELDNWEKAEQLAGKLKKLIPNEQRKILRLLFSIRREDHDLSLSILNEIIC